MGCIKTSRVPRGSAGQNFPTPGLEPWGKGMGVGGALQSEDIGQEDFKEIAKHGFCLWEFIVLLRISEIHAWNCLRKIDEQQKVNQY